MSGLEDKQAGMTACEVLFTGLYPELKRLARSRLRRGAAFTLVDTTALVHETWLRLSQRHGIALTERAHFLAYAAKVMRSIVVDHARQRLAEKRGGAAPLADIDEQPHLAAPSQSSDVLALNDALQALEKLDPALAQLVELRYFAGMSEDETAEVLGSSKRTVQRNWQKARALLLEVLD